MTVVKIFLPENRLKSVIGRPSDPSIESLARDAEMRAATLGEELRRHVQKRCAELIRLAGGPEETIFGESLAIDAAALDVCELAAAAGLNTIGEAARGVHAMIRALVERGVWHSEALQAHLDALGMLQSDSPPAGRDAESLLARLAALRRWVGVDVAAV